MITAPVRTRVAELPDGSDGSDAARRPTIDRSGCRGHRQRGTHGSVEDYWSGCRCRDAYRAKKRYDKLRKAGASPDRRVLAIGTVRRLQALGAQGWSAALLSQQPELEGWSRSLVTDTRAGGRNGGRARAMIATRKHRQVLALVARIGTAAPPEPDSKTLVIATRNGWARLDQWEPEDIDNPDAQSDLAYARPAETRPRLHFDDVAFLRSPAGGGLSFDQIGRQLGFPATSVERCWHRARQVQAQGGRKLTDEQIREIRSKWPQVRAKTLAQADLAEHYGVSRTLITHVLQGKVAPHLELHDLTVDKRAADRAYHQHKKTSVGRSPAGKHAASPGGPTEERRAA